MAVPRLLQTSLVYHPLERITEMPRPIASIAIPEELARQMPLDPAEQQEVVILGLREWRIRRALEGYRRGEGSLAYAARQAGISLREMIPLAYAHGLTPKVENAGADDPGL